MIDLIDKRFGRLIVLKQVNNISGRQTRWLCQCNCKNKTIVQAGNLKNGHTQSCGCISKEKLIERSTHGHSKNKNKSKIYIAWLNMKARCINPNNNRYKDYGKRGIIICEQWINSF